MHAASICVRFFGIQSSGHSAPSRYGGPPATRKSARAKPSRATPESIAMSPQPHTYGEFRQQIHQDSPLGTRNVISKRPRLRFIRIRQLIAIAALGLLFWLGLSVSRHHEPRPSYPYYDTEKPVPPWSEPAPLKGNYSKEGVTNEHSTSTTYHVSQSPHVFRAPAADPPRPADPT